jgi:hypothetical protein
MTEVYGSSTVKRRRSTNAEIAEVDRAIIAACELEHPITLRGVFYRIEYEGAVEKSDAGYRLTGRRLLALRRERIVPYSWITDGTRWVVKPDTWDDLDQMLDDAGASYRRALWNDQDVEVHFFTEKDALTGVISPVTEEWDVPLGVLRGYASESFAYSMAEAIAHANSRDKLVYVYQLGDHDPSGVDAWRDFERKVTAFVKDMRAGYCAAFFERIAVLPRQIHEYDLHTRPTKRTDSRAAGFIGESVEVDAIPPTILRELVRDAIEQHIDPEQLRLTEIAENSEREVFERMRGRS